VETKLTKAAFEVNHTHVFSIKLHNIKQGGTVQILIKTQDDQELKAEVIKCKKANSNTAKILAMQ
jgi:phosphotransferase system HPr-like phosphotransfer protein